MSKLLSKYISIVATIYLLSLAIDSITIHSIPALLVLGLVLLIVNMFIKPFILLLTLPFSMVTFGLFTFVVNAWTIMIADSLVSSVNMGGFLNSLLAAFIIAILQHILTDKSK
ncbi:phage holin family protein [Lacrimispora sp. 38-1]|uniref:phage holin family protein n=1 Tax=Lacrimispora sp. 38-1 TaxID=3125778 RepID=UPI003CE75DAB